MYFLTDNIISIMLNRKCKILVISSITNML